MAAEAAISSVVELLGDLLIQKVKSLRGVEGKVRLLKDELKSMQAFLKDANTKQVKEERVRDWIRELREIAYDAEDTIEMFLVNVEDVKSRGLVKRCIAFPKRMHHLGRIGDEIESIRARLVEIHKRRDEYGIQIVEEAEREMSQFELQRRLCPWKKDEHLVGIQDDVEKLMRESILNEEKRGLSVAVIQGMGGIGKSTIAREIYNHPDVVDGPFDRRCWVVVSSEFTPRETIKQLISQLCRSEQEKKELLEEIQNLEQSTKAEHYLLQKLQEMLHNQLEGTNYFIVMDDVWEQHHWDYFNTAFPNQQDKTSRLILTSRNEIIGKHDQYVLKVKLLDPKKSWELFLKRAFINNTNGTFSDELQSIGRQILKKCDGLPLAISVAGGLLVDSQDNRRWQQVLDQIDFNISKNNIPDILGLSYHNLSPQLKSCFLCLAFFMEDYTIPAKWLISIWHAQGLIQKERSRSIEDIGSGYLNELVNRSMLHVQDLTFDGRVKSFRLHDLLRDVCLSKAEEEMSLKIVKVEGEGECSSKSSYKSRHHAVYGKSFETLSSSQNKYLRSAFLVDVRRNSGIIDFPTPYWKSFQLLKILNLDGFQSKELPNSFRCLVGLKYLRIHTYSFTCLELPRWFGDFKKLEFLYVECVAFPGVALKMESLHDFGTHLMYGTAMKVEKWNNIESLKGIRLEDLAEMSSRLTPHPHLRELRLYERSYDTKDGMVDMGRESLQKMTNLVKLHLKFEIDRITWSNLIPNLESLTSLKLKSGTSLLTCPAASVFPPNLSHLTLSHVRHPSMQELGKLPKLQYLTLNDSRLYNRMEILHDGFPCLNALSLKLMYIRGIDIDDGGMPCLTQLRIRKCPYILTENLPKHIIISFA